MRRGMEGLRPWEKRSRARKSPFLPVFPMAISHPKSYNQLNDRNFFGFRPETADPALRFGTFSRLARARRWRPTENFVK